MEDLDKERRSIARLVGGYIGLDPRQPREMLAQSRIMGAESEILALPELYTPTPVVDLDTASPTFGERSFMLGYHALGSRPLGYG